MFTVLNSALSRTRVRGRGGRWLWTDCFLAYSVCTWSLGIWRSEWVRETVKEPLANHFYLNNSLLFKKQERHNFFGSSLIDEKECSWPCLPPEVETGKENHKAWGGRGDDFISSGSFFFHVRVKGLVCVCCLGFLFQRLPNTWSPRRDSGSLVPYLDKTWKVQRWLRSSWNKGSYEIVFSTCVDFYYLAHDLHRSFKPEVFSECICQELQMYGDSGPVTLLAICGRVQGIRVMTWGLKVFIVYSSVPYKYYFFLLCSEFLKGCED